MVSSNGGDLKPSSPLFAQNKVKQTRPNRGDLGGGGGRKRRRGGSDSLLSVTEQKVVVYFAFSKLWFVEFFLSTGANCDFIS